MKAISVAAVGVGMLLLLGSVLWGALFPAEKSWTNEKDQQMADLAMKAHRLGAAVDAAKRHPSMHGPSAAELQSQYQQVVAEHAGLKAEFESARDAPKTASAFLRWSGIAFVAAGALVVFASRNG